LLFVALFHDDREKSQVRSEQMKAHLEYLDREKHRILAAGPLREEPDENARGSLWIVEASNKQEVVRLCHGDPFWLEGLRKWVTVLHWPKASTDWKMPI